MIRKHRSKPKKRRNQTKAKPLHPERLSCLCTYPVLEILLPGFEADHLSAAFPILQTADGNAHLSGEGLLSQAVGCPVFLNLPGLSIAEEAVIAVQQVIYWDFKERCQLVSRGLVESIEIAGLQVDICIAGDARHPCHLFLHQPQAVTAEAQAVGDIVDVLIAVVLLVEKLGFQKLARCHQTKSMYVKEGVSELSVLIAGHNVQSVAQRVRDMPLTPAVLVQKPIRERVAFCKHFPAYVANLVPFSTLKESIAFISPMVPIEIRSS